MSEDDRNAKRNTDASQGNDRRIRVVSIEEQRIVDEIYEAADRFFEALEDQSLEAIDRQNGARRDLRRILKIWKLQQNKKQVGDLASEGESATREEIIDAASRFYEAADRIFESFGDQATDAIRLGRRPAGNTQDTSGKPE